MRFAWSLGFVWVATSFVSCGGAQTPAATSEAGRSDSNGLVITNGTGPARSGKQDTPGRADRATIDVGVFGAGHCEFGDCTKNGWTLSTEADEKVQVRCKFHDCLKSGWTTTVTTAGGSTTLYETKCTFNDCAKFGSVTATSEGSITTTCAFHDCLKSGWTTVYPDGKDSRTSCAFGDCMKNGWTTSTSAGGPRRCECGFSDCVKNGASCHD